MFDSISRILLFSTWLYVVNDGQFSSTKTVIAYYSTLLVLLVFNSILNKQNDYTSARNWIGKEESKTFPWIDDCFIIEIFFNSTSSVLSYNNFDFGPIFSKQKSNGMDSDGQRHEPTFFKQTFYWLLFTVLNLGYSNLC